MEHKILTILQEYLRHDEAVLWHGSAEPCKLLEADDKGRIIRNWIITVIAFGALLGFYLTSAPQVSIALAAGIAIVMLIILIAPWSEWRKLKVQNYWVTNQRVISLVGTDECCGIDLALVDAVDVKKLSTGYDCLRLCKRIVNEPVKQMRWRSGNPADGGGEGEVGLVFYNIADAQGAMDAIRKAKEQA